MKSAYEAAMEGCNKALADTITAASKEYTTCMNGAGAQRGQSGREKEQGKCKTAYDDTMKKAREDWEVNKELVEKNFGDTKPK